LPSRKSKAYGVVQGSEIWRVLLGKADDDEAARSLTPELSDQHARRCRSLFSSGIEEAGASLSFCQFEIVNPFSQL
jgi:hypothetical protein